MIVVPRSQLVECPQKSGQCLAGSGGRYDEGVRAACYGFPRAELSRCWGAEGTVEPFSCRGRELFEDVGHVSIVHLPTDSVFKPVEDLSGTIFFL